MTNKEIFNHRCKKVNNEQARYSKNLNIYQKNYFQYLSDMGDNLEDDINDIHSKGGAQRKSYYNAVRSKDGKRKYMQDIQLSQIDLIVPLIWILIF